MENETLKGYIDAERARNVADDDIHKELLAKGWDQREVQAALLSNASYVTQESSELPTFGSLISRSWNGYVSRKEFLTKIGLILFFTSLCSSFASTYFGYADRSIAIPGNDSPVHVALYICILVASWVVSFWVSATIYKAQADNEFSTASVALTRGWSNTGRYFLASFAAAFIAIVGLFLLIVPGVIFGTWFAFAGIIAVAEGKGMSDSLSASKAYAKGRWWQVFWRLCAVTLLVVIITGVIVMFFGFFFSSGVSASIYILEVLKSAVGTMTSLYLFIFLFEFYKALAATAHPSATSAES